MQIQSATFETSSPDLETCPDSDLAEFAFIGRSNVGKSSLINALTNKKDLAVVSNTPGRTRLINFFLIKLFIFKYISQYNEMTKQEKGKVGPLFYHFIVPMWLAFAGLLIWIIFSL